MIANSFLLTYFLGIILFFALIAIIVNSIFYFIPKMKSKWARVTNISVFTALTFSCLGLSIGLITGLSRIPIANVILPAILTFIGGFSAYLFTIKRKDINEVKSSIIIIFLSISICFGAEIGADYRIENETFEKEQEHWFNKDLETHKAILELNKSGIHNIEIIDNDTIQ